MAPGPAVAEPLTLDEVAPAPMMMFKTMVTATEARVHHQYSLRLARPENVAYFLKTRLTATGKDAP